MELLGLFQFICLSCEKVTHNQISNNMKSSTIANTLTLLFITLFGIIITLSWGNSVNIIDTITEHLTVSSIRIVLFISYFFVGWILIRTWSRTISQERDEKDLSFILIAIYLFLISLANIIKVTQGVGPAKFHLPSKLIETISNAFLFAALPYFTHVFNQIKHRYNFSKNSPKWVASVLIINGLLVLLMFVYHEDGNKQTESIITVFESIYNVITLSLFFYAITRSFIKRGYGVLFSITTFVVWLGFMMTAIVVITSSVNPIILILYTLSKIAFLIVLMVLLQTWAVETKNNVDKSNVKHVLYIARPSFVADTLAVLFLLSALSGVIAITFNDVTDLRIYTLLFFECFSGIAIVYIWLYIEKTKVGYKEKEDVGLALFAYAIFMWSVGDNFKIWGMEDPLIHNCISTVNSFFFLYSIKYLETKEGTALQQLSRKLRMPILEKDITLFSITAIVLIANIVCWEYYTDETFMLSIFEIYKNITPDFCLSCVTIFTLLYFFDMVFKVRGFKQFQFRLLIGLTILVTLTAQLSGFISVTGQLPEIIIVAKAIYRPLLIVLFFILSASWLRHTKEEMREDLQKMAEEKAQMAENQRKDMNHAIRGTLNLLSDDLERQINEVRYDDNKYATFLALNDIKMRADAMYNLHNLIHRESGEGVEVKPLVSQCLSNIKEGLNYDKMPLNGYETLGDFKCNRVNAQKMMGILLELAINSNKVANKLMNEGNERLKGEGKKINISLKEKGANLVITVEDNGKPYTQKCDKGHGLKQVKRTVIGDWKGTINYYENEMNGTTCVITIPLVNIKTN